LIELKIGAATAFSNPLAKEILHYEQKLDLRQALMSRRIIFKDEAGRVTELNMQRLASMHRPHFAAIQYRITAHNYTEEITIRSALDGTVINYGVERYRELNAQHLLPVSVYHQAGESCLVVQTKASHVRIHIQARNSLYQDDVPLPAARQFSTALGFIAEDITFTVRQERTCTLEKLVYIYTSRDRDVEEEQATEKSLPADLTYARLVAEHTASWQQLWEIADFTITGDRFAQKVIRLYIYHLLITASLHNKKIDAGIPARGWHGEAYRGHIFWDELFVFPFYNLHFPEITRALLLYRYRRLDAARAYARENGYAGAMYPWQSADTGQEETQELHYNPRSGKWDPDLSRLQRHVSLAIAYNIWEYYYTTNDLDFLHNYGVEMMLEITRFWASIADYDATDDRYHIKGVMGPDEFHEKYPKPWFGLAAGFKDNAYTNIIAAWVMHKTIETVEHLPATVITHLGHKIDFRLTEMERWREIVKCLKVDITDEGIIEQFSGFKDLLELDLEAYRHKYKDIHRLDRILKAAGDSPDKYKIIKQADVLMIYYLLSPEQVNHTLGLMGYTLGEPREVMRRNYEYYLRRTTHGSTLSYVVHASLPRYLKTHRQYMHSWFLKALESDIHDIQGGTTPEGIHTGVMGGTIEIIIKSFAGINIFKDCIRLEPFLPKHWHKLIFRIVHRGNLFEFELTQDTITLEQLRVSAEPVTIRIGAVHYYPALGKKLKIPYTSAS
jgi:trehalose/maltose hydrolase-like predicted phosphorylase